VIHGYTPKKQFKTKKGDITMNQQNNTQTINVVNPVCCGLDVHKKVILACLIVTDAQGNEHITIREFSTFYNSLIKLRDWLIENDCPIVAMESTGIYWRPIHNILEDYIQVVLVNARHVKNLPGRKTDTSDSCWLAGLLKHGLLKGSFIPPKNIRTWRDLTRTRQKHVQNVGEYKQRTQKLLESANIKIDCVISDLFGASGTGLLNLLAEGKEISLEDINQVVHWSVRHKSEELLISIEGHFTEHHVFLLGAHLETIKFHQSQIKAIDERLKSMMTDIEPLIKELDRIPGIDEVAARAILAEIGISLDEFESSDNLCSWSGLCPGNNETAGKRKSGKSSVKKHLLKTIMVEVAWAAIKKKNSYYKEKYHRLKSRRGPKKAIIAIAHKILKVIYNIVKHGCEYQDLGEEYLNKINKQTKIRNLNKQAAALGMKLVPIGS